MNEINMLKTWKQIAAKWMKNVSKAWTSNAAQWLKKCLKSSTSNAAKWTNIAFQKTWMSNVAK
jgi:hypothetical protein